MSVGSFWKKIRADLGVYWAFRIGSYECQFFWGLVLMYLYQEVKKKIMQLIHRWNLYFIFLVIEPIIHLHNCLTVTGHSRDADTHTSPKPKTNLASNHLFSLQIPSAHRHTQTYTDRHRNTHTDTCPTGEICISFRYTVMCDLKECFSFLTTVYYV